MSSEIPLEFRPRLCHMVRWPHFQGYGFNLHAEKGKAGQFIGKVDDNSPAEIAGLKEGDRIVEVNGTNIGNENHQQVVTRIRQGGDETELLVVDSASDDWFKDNKVVIKGDLPGVVFKSARLDQADEEEPEAEAEQEPEPEVVPEPEPEVEAETEPLPEPIPEPVIEKDESEVVEVAPVSNGNGINEDDLHKPRLCHLKIWPHFQGYGFNLHAEKDRPGQYIGLVDDDSPASTAGLLVNDRIVEVNGQNVEKESHSVVIASIKATPGETRLLVVDPQVDKYYREKDVTVHNGMPQVVYIVTPDSADTANEVEAVAALDAIPAASDDDGSSKTAADEEEEKKFDDVDSVDAATPANGFEGVEPEVEEIAELENNLNELELSDKEVESLYAEPDVDPEPLPTEPEPLPEPERLPEPEPLVEEPVNGVKKQEAPSPPEPEFTVADEPEPVSAPPVKSAPVPEPEPEPTVPRPAQEDGLMLNMSVAEMKERLKAKKKQDPRHSKISFEKKYQQFERM